MKVRISTRVRNKLRDKHQVTDTELRECLENRTGRDLFDTRAEHQTDPRTRWFLAYTNHRRLRRIVFIPDPSGQGVTIKTAYEPNAEEVRIFRTHALP